jgi:tRNA(Arg) A34 adenosine deaminase TadA
VRPPRAGRSSAQPATGSTTARDRPGEIFGSALAHAETNVLARLPFRSRRDLVLTTTLQPCLQCAAAIRLGPVATVRFAGPDRYWDGCHDFGRLSAREADLPPSYEQASTPPRGSDTCGPGSGN